MGKEIVYQQGKQDWEDLPENYTMSTLVKYMERCLKFAKIDEEHCRVRKVCCQERHENDEEFGIHVELSIKNATRILAELASFGSGALRALRCGGATISGVARGPATRDPPCLSDRWH